MLPYFKLSTFFAPAVYIGISGNLFAANVSIYNWEAYLSPKIIQLFEEKTGHTVTQTYFDNDHNIGTLFYSGKSNFFDLIMVQSSRATLFGEGGYLKPVASLNLKNLSQLNSRWRNSCGDYSIPYSWGTTGLAYRTSVAKTDITSWEAFFYPSDEFKEKIVAQTDTTTLTETALLYLGKNPNTDNLDDLKQAYTILVNQKPDILEYKYGITYVSEFKNKSKMAMTLAFSGDVEEIITQTGQDDWVYTIPKEGSMLWVDCLSFPAKKMTTAATIEFVNFLNTPKIAALNSVDVYITTPNDAAMALLPKALLEDEELYPESNLIEKLSYPYKTLSDESYKIRQKMMNSLTLDK
ncbi:ABC transporter substrate-binding protein [Marinomonas algicola]|uniref:ABC transporter substrate-binding protein n=1 Tax=Marinomonas algicola TaxID=2773454 RepID=UPI00174DC1B9|nr:extracellular solute-binding protein [Marinomonas algicola]